MNIQTISTKELRENFSQVKSAMEAGQSLVLLYRSKPLAEIKPVRKSGLRARRFSLSQIKRWIADDQLSPRQQRQIQAIVGRLP